MNYDDLIKRPVAPIAGQPLVSFLCMTYGRAAKQPDVLNECVFWIVNQDYPNVECVIVNDAPGQTLVCDHPRVKCINLPERVPDLGTKMDLACLFASGSICLVNDDDDISLPGRALQAVEKLSDDGGYDYWAPRLWVYAHRGAPPMIDGNGYSYNACAFRRESMLGNHPKAIKGHDMEAAGWAEKHLPCNPYRLTNPTQVQFVYRWNVSLMHLSGNPDPIAAFYRHDTGRPGLYHVVPKVAEDWVVVKDHAVRRALAAT